MPCVNAAHWDHENYVNESYCVGTEFFFCFKIAIMKPHLDRKDLVLCWTPLVWICITVYNGLQILHLKANWWTFFLFNGELQDLYNISTHSFSWWISYCMQSQAGITQICKYTLDSQKNNSSSEQFRFIFKGIVRPKNENVLITHPNVFPHHYDILSLVQQLLFSQLHWELKLSSFKRTINVTFIDESLVFWSHLVRNKPVL